MPGPIRETCQNCQRQSNAGRTGTALNSVIFLLFLCAALFPPVASGQAKEIRRVLILNELGLYWPAINSMNQEIFTALRSSPYQIEFYSENLDTTLFSDPASQREFRDWYYHKYRDRKPDVIVAIGPAPIDLAAESHQVFSDTPVVFWGLSESGLTPALGPRFAGIWAIPEPEKTLDAALQLLPGTRHAVVTGGSSPFDRQVIALYRERFRPYESRVDFTYLTDLTMPDLLERLKHLPSDTVVVHGAVLQDAAGTNFINADVVSMEARVASAPVFIVDDPALGKGPVGGHVLSYSRTGRELAHMALRILGGQKPQDIPIVRGGNAYMFDWQALRRWGLQESNLPPGSSVLYRQLTFWEVYRWRIGGGISVILLETALILGLLWHRRKRRKAEAEQLQAEQHVRESEQRFRLVANTAPVMIWMSNPDKLCHYLNQAWLDFTGRSLETELGSGWAQGLHPEDAEDCLKTYTEAFDRREPFKMRYRIRRYDGEYRWVFDVGVPRYDSDSSFAGYIGSCLDVTEQKLAEEALAGVGCKLIEAHEEERTWIARELHDDINQRLALVVIQMSRGIQEASLFGDRTPRFYARRPALHRRDHQGCAEPVAPPAFFQT